MKRLLTLALVSLTVLAASAAPGMHKPIGVKEAKQSVHRASVDRNKAGNLLELKTSVGELKSLTRTCPDLRSVANSNDSKLKAQRRAATQDPFILINFPDVLPAYQQIAGPISLPSGAIPWNFLQTTNQEYIYGQQLLIFNGGLYLGFTNQNYGFSAADQALVVARLDGTQPIQVVLEAGTVENTNGSALYIFLIDETTNQEIDRQMISVPYSQTDYLGYKFDATSYKNVRVEVRPVYNNIPCFVFQLEIDAAPADFTIAAPRRVNHTVADDNKSFSITSQLPANANFNQFYVYKQKDFTTATNEYAVFSANFDNINLPGTSITNTDKSMCFAMNRFDAIPGGWVYGMSNITGELGFRLDNNWGEYMASDYGFETDELDLSPTSGAMNVSFKYRPGSDYNAVVVVRFVYNKTSESFELDNNTRFLIASSYDADALDASHSYDYSKVGQQLNFSADFPAVNTRTYDPSRIVLVVAPFNSDAGSGTTYITFDDVVVKMKNIPAGTSTINLAGAFYNSEGNLTISANLEEEGVKFWYTVMGLNRDNYFNDTYGEWYLQNDYLVPIDVVTSVDAPTFTVNGTALTDLGTPEHPVQLIYGDLIRFEVPDGTTLNAVYNSDVNDGFTPATAMGMMTESIGGFDVTVWRAYADGNICAKSVKTADLYGEATLYYTVKMPAVRVAANTDMDCFEPGFANLLLADNDHIASAPDNTLVLASIVNDLDSNIPADESWLTHISYSIDYYAGDSESVTSQVAKTVSADCIESISIPADFYGKAVLHLAPVSRYGDMGDEVDFTVYFDAPEVVIPAAPVLKVKKLDGTIDNVESGSALSLDYGDMIIVEVEAGADLSGTFTPALPSGAEAVEPVSFTSTEWGAYANGEVAVKAFTTSGESEVVTVAYTVALPAVKILAAEAFDSNGAVTDDYVELIRTDKPDDFIYKLHGLAKIKLSAAPAVASSPADEWLPRIKYRFNLHPGLVAYGTSIDAITMPETRVTSEGECEVILNDMINELVPDFWGGIEIEAVVVDRYGNEDESQALNDYVLLATTQKLDLDFATVLWNPDNAVSHVVFSYDMEKYPASSSPYFYVRVIEDGLTMYYTNNPEYPAYGATESPARVQRRDEGEHQDGGNHYDGNDSNGNPINFLYYSHAGVGADQLAVPFNPNTVTNITFLVDDVEGNYDNSSRRTLVYDPATGEVITTGVEGVEADCMLYLPQYYTLQGYRVAHPQRGQVYIVVLGDSVTKQLIK